MIKIMHVHGRETIQICVIQSWVTGDDLIIAETRRQMHGTLLHYVFALGCVWNFPQLHFPKEPNIHSCVCVLAKVFTDTYMCLFVWNRILIYISCSFASRRCLNSLSLVRTTEQYRQERESNWLTVTERMRFCTARRNGSRKHTPRHTHITCRKLQERPSAVVLPNSSPARLVSGRAASNGSVTRKVCTQSLSGPPVESAQSPEYSVCLSPQGIEAVNTPGQKACSIPGPIYHSLFEITMKQCEQKQ